MELPELSQLRAGEKAILSLSCHLNVELKVGGNRGEIEKVLWFLCGGLDGHVGSAGVRC